MARYSASHPEVHQKAVAQYSVNHPEKSRTRQGRYIFQKKCSFRKQLEVTLMLSEKLNDRLEAEKLVKWFIQNRKSKIKNYLKVQ